MFNMRIVILPMLWICLLPQNSFSQTKDTLKSHYHFWSINLMFPSVPEPLKTRVASLIIVPGIRHIPIHMDGLGYYRPRGDRWLYGGVLQLCIDRYSAYRNWFQTEYYQPSISIIYFMDNAMYKSGLFIRGDGGPAVIRFASRDAGHEKINWGFGLLTSGGYSFRYQKIQLLLSVNYAFKLLGLKPYHFISTGMGTLF